MKLTLTLHDHTYSVESQDSFDGQDVHELTEQFRGLMVTAGFHPECVDQMFNLDSSWFDREQPSDNPDQLSLNWPEDLHNKHDRYDMHSQLS